MKLHRTMVKAEVARERSKVLSESSWSGTNLAVKVIVLLLYLFILSMMISYNEVMSASFLVFALLGAYVLFIPATLHGCIAGERESRSLDILLTAPVSTQEVVMSKLARAIIPMTWLALALGIPGLVLAIIAEVNGSRYHEEGLFNFVVGFVYVLVAGGAISCLVTYISSRAKTTAAALMSTVGVFFIGLIVYPVIFGMFAMVSGDLSDSMFWFLGHPFVMLGALYGDMDDHLMWMFFSVLLMVMGSIGLVAMASQHLKSEYHEGTGLRRQEEEGSPKEV